MRDLAQVNTISSLIPIEGADKIELATFKECGWQIIVNKGEFKVGDLAVRVEVDAILPIRPEFEFLRERCWKEKYGGFLIKAIKMKGVISQGIVFPVSILPKRKKFFFITVAPKAGEDVTDLLSIRKWEPEEDASPQRKSKLPVWCTFLLQFDATRGLARKYIEWRFGKKDSGSFPSELISKTDETQIQNCSAILSRFADVAAYITIKLEGMSGTFLLKPDKKVKGGKFIACSRNLAYPTKVASNVHWKVAEQYKIEDALRHWFEKTGHYMAIQGEVTGEGIQKNYYGLTGYEFHVFTVKDLTENRLLGYTEIVDFLKETSLPMVPVLSAGVPLRKSIPDIDTGIKLSEQYTHVHGKTGAKLLDEGIVIRGMENEFSFKIRNPTYVFNWSKKEGEST